jgi:hypothetical protein
MLYVLFALELLAAWVCGLLHASGLVTRDAIWATCSRRGSSFSDYFDRSRAESGAQEVLSESIKGLGMYSTSSVGFSAQGTALHLYCRLEVV